MMDKKESIDNDKIYQLEELAKGNIFPVTIIHYAHDELSGAKWLALQSFSDEIPNKIVSSMDDMERFWKEHDDLKSPIGKGNTPDEALEDLKEKAKKYYESL